MVIIVPSTGWWGRIVDDTGGHCHCRCCHRWGVGCIVDSCGVVMSLSLLPSGCWSCRRQSWDGHVIVAGGVGGLVLNINYCCGLFTDYISARAHYSRVRSTLVPSVACQTTEGEYYSTNHLLPTDTL